MRLASLRHRAPVAVQNLAKAAFRRRQRRLRYGGQFNCFVDELEANQWRPRERQVEHQATRLQAIVRFAAETVPFYRAQFEHLGIGPSDIKSIDDLARLPLLDKETVRRQPESFVPTRHAEPLIPRTTGGTTGNPLRYFVTPSALQFDLAMAEARFHRWAGVSLGQRTAIFRGRSIVPIDRRRPPFWRRDPAFNEMYFSAFHMTDEHLPAYARELARFRPEVIVGYASTVHVLARLISRSRSAVAIRPKAVLVSSETLFDWMRRDIEEAFSCRVFDAYGIGEMVAFISECPAGSLHVNPEYGVVETIPTQGAHELVATGLFNYATPLIRYRTGDLVDGFDSAPCECGREMPTVGRILGRIDDGVVTPEGARVGPAALSVAFQSVPNLRGAQIHQSTPAKAVIQIAVTDDFSAEDEALLVRELRRQLGHTIGLDSKRVRHIRRTPGGKQRLVVSTLRNGQPG